METKNQTNTKIATLSENTSIVKKLETAIPRTPATGKKLMLITASIGFAICFSGLIYGNQFFALGFIFMLCSATGFRLIDNGKIFG